MAGVRPGRRAGHRRGRVPFAGPPRPGVAQGARARHGPARRPAVDVVARPGGRVRVGARGRVGPERCDRAPSADAATPAFLGVRQQHPDVDVRAVVRAALGTGRGRRRRGAPVGERPRAPVRHPRGHGPERRWSPCTGGVASSPSWVELSLRGGRRARDADGARARPGVLLARRATVTQAPVTVAVADGRALDSVATGGFLGLWIGVYATSNGRPSATIVQVERLEYVPRESDGAGRRAEGRLPASTGVTARARSCAGNSACQTLSITF